MLHRARLPRPTIALAACILDALSPSFPRHWAAAQNPHSHSRSHSHSHTRTLSLTPPSSPTSPRPPRKDALVPLAALKLAHAFLHDGGGAARGRGAASALRWADSVAGGAFDARDVEAAVWALLLDLGYRLHGFEPAAVEAMGRVLFAPVERGGAGEGRREADGWEAEGCGC